MQANQLRSVFGFIPTLAAAAMLLVVSSTVRQQGHAVNAADVKIFKAEDPSNLKLAFVTNNASEFWKIAAAGVH